MERPPLKERLIGTLVILCLAIIFYPLIFDSQQEFEVRRDSVIPSRTIEVRPLQILEPSQPFEAQAINPDELFNPDEQSDQTRIDPNDSKILTGSGLPQAWVIQVGSFASIDNAKLLNESLLAQGYKAYFRLTESSDERPDLYKVMVGPMLDASEAERVLAQLKAENQSQAILLRFEP